MKYADRVVAARQKYLDIGSQFGAQRMADLVSIALNDPSVMGRNALGAERIGRVFQRVKELEATFDRAFCQNAEQDYWQDVLDRKLHEIFPDSYGFAPFSERYPFIKEVRYGK